MERWALLALLALGFPGPERGDGSPPDLDPGGRHVCRAAGSEPPALSCCPGWTQVGQECPLALCTGAGACLEEEVCVRPGVCRCRPGFFGANCSARCPEQYWGPECKRRCRCHPRGTCHPVSGECSCHPGWWGPLCQSACQCGQRGRCHPVTGACQCEPGWWAPDCRRQCPCNLAGSRCDPVTGRCLCHRGWWGRRCASLCSCNGSPCLQESGRCECQGVRWGAACQHPCQCSHGTCAPQDGRCACRAGYRGQRCAEACPAGTYGPQCAHSCGHCRHQAPCSPTDGICLACDPGWNGTHCQQLCAPGLYGENCTQLCPPRCRQGEACHLQTGACQNCEAGFTGARCEAPCPPGFFGEGCQFPCPDCSNGRCDPASGACLCQDGYWGTSCNRTCPEAFRGPNCSEACPPLSGACQWRGVQGLLAGVLTPLSLLLCLCCCCCCHRHRQQLAARGSGDRVITANGGPPSRAQHRLVAVLANFSAAWPCSSLRGSTLPQVTVAHHDMEIPFTPSFIEAASVAWIPESSSSSSSDAAGEGKGGYQGPEATLSPGEAPEGSGQPCLPPLATPQPEPFAIPRTSSVAKVKRPFVSFAEGTPFGLHTPTETLSSTRAQKASWRPFWVRSPLQPSRSEAALRDLPDRVGYENKAPAPWEEEEEEESHGPPVCSHPGARKRRAGGSWPGQAGEAVTKAPGSEQRATTIYVTVGQTRGSSEGPWHPSPPAASQPACPEHGHSLGAIGGLTQVPPDAALKAGEGTARLPAPDPDLGLDEASPRWPLPGREAAWSQRVSRVPFPAWAPSPAEPCAI